MRRTHRLVAAAVLMAFSGALAGCSSFDPSDMLDFLDTKKKLPGDRKPVFPEGVPGLEQGVPKELYKGAQQDTQNPDVAAAPAAPVEPAPKGKGAKGKKSKAAATAAAPAEVNGEAAAEEEAPPAVPAPKAKKIARKRTTATPPDATEAQPAQAAAPQQPAQGFPAPLPSGTFSR